MALGGGMYTTQNKVLPGAYINFVSAAKASATLGDRGTAAFPLSLSWGPEQTIVTIENSEFQKDSLALVGYAYTADEVQPLREIFANAKTLHLFRLNSGGSKATNKFATAKYPGTAGNNLKIIIQKGEEYTTSNVVYDVMTYMGDSLVDTQKNVKSMADLASNKFVDWLTTATIVETTGITLSGGTDGTVADGAYQTFLDKAESYSFNTVGCDTTNDTIKALFANWTKRLRDEQGVKFQTVLHNYTKADYEGIISVKNGLSGNESAASLVYWVTGAECACAVNKSMTNATYTGEYDVATDYTQTQLENAMQAGELVFHKVGDDVRVLSDINTFVSVTDEKSSDFGSNQVIRVLDQIGNDIASLFASKYLGKVQNDAAGRVSLWNDIVSHHNQLQTIRAIEGFDSANVTVAQGDLKKAVVVEDHVQPVAAMEQLYMKVIIE